VLPKSNSERLGLPSKLQRVRLLKSTSAPRRRPRESLVKVTPRVLPWTCEEKATPLTPSLWLRAPESLAEV